MDGWDLGEQEGLFQRTREEEKENEVPNHKEKEEKEFYSIEEEFVSPLPMDEEENGQKGGGSEGEKEGVPLKSVKAWLSPVVGGEGGEGEGGEGLDESLGKIEEEMKRVEEEMKIVEQEIFSSYSLEVCVIYIPVSKGL